MSTKITATRGQIKNIETEELKIVREPTDLRWSNSNKHIDITLLNGGSSAKLDDVYSGARAIIAADGNVVGTDVQEWIFRFHSISTVSVGLAEETRDLGTLVPNGDHVSAQYNITDNSVMTFSLNNTRLKIDYIGKSRIIDMLPFTGKTMYPWISSTPHTDGFSVSISTYRYMKMYINNNIAYIDTSTDSSAAIPLLIDTGGAGVILGSTPVLINNIVAVPPSDLVMVEGTNNLGIRIKDTTGAVSIDEVILTDTIKDKAETVTIDLSTPNTIELASTDVTINTLPLYDNSTVFSTGVITGGLLSAASGTTFSISDGTGFICTDDPLGTGVNTRSSVTWSGQTGIAVTNLLTAQQSYIIIDVAGNVQQYTNRRSNAERRGEIYIGKLSHKDTTLLNGVHNEQDYVAMPMSQTRDLYDAIGVLNIAGNTLTTNGANLTFIKTIGTQFSSGSNYVNDPDNPHKLILPLFDSSITTFAYVLRDSICVDGFNDVDISNYDAAGVLTPVSPATMFTIQRVYVNSSNEITIQYGQSLYSSMVEAEQAIFLESFIAASITATQLLIGYLISIANTSDLESGDSKFILSGKFGAAHVSAPIADLQSAYAASLSNPEILTDSTGGALTVRAGVADANNVLEIQNMAGTNTVTITGEGTVDAVSLNVGALGVTDDIKMNSNDILNIGITAGLGLVVETNTTNNTGSVTVHSDVTNAGSGDIITALERTAIGTNTTNNTGSVTVHSDVTNAGSGDIITALERTAIGTNTTDISGLETNKLDVAAFTDTAVTSKLITGFTPGAGPVGSGDTILEAINKLDGNQASSVDNTTLFSTGVQSGGILSIAGVTTFSITDGSGFVCTDDPLGTGNNTRTAVSWTGKTGISVTSIGSAQITYVSIDSTGTVKQYTTPRVNGDRRAEIYLGQLIHPIPNTLSSVFNEQDYTVMPLSQTRDLALAIGGLNTSGNVISTAGLLTFQKTAGTQYKLNSNYVNDPSAPSILSMPFFDSGVTTFAYVTQTGTFVSGYNNVDVANYDVAGTVTAVSPTSRYTIQHVYVSGTNTILVQYGQNLYSSLLNAERAVTSESYVTAPNLANALLVGYIITIASTGDLETPGDSTLLQAGKFGSTSGSFAQSTLQNAYEASLANPEILTNAVGDAVAIRAGVADANTVLEIQNAAGTNNATITGDGVIDATEYKRGGIQTEQSLLIGTNSVRGQSTTASGTIGSCCIAAGVRAFEQLELSGSDNTAFGCEAGQFVETSGNNTAIGRQALRANGWLSGGQNTAVGAGAMLNSISHQSCTAIGSGALRDSNVGNYQVAIGTNSGWGIEGNNSIAIGLSSLQSVSTGVNLIGIGANCDVSPASSSWENSICIGSGSQINASNQCTLGDVNMASIRTRGNGVCDLGESGSKFKDLHLSGVIPNTYSTASGLGSLAYQSGTGVISGGTITINADDTKYDISDGRGVVLDTSTGIMVDVNWSGLAAQNVGSPYSGIITYISITSAGSIVTSTLPPTNSQIRTNIFLGAIEHANSTNIDTVITEPMCLVGANDQLRDIVKAIGRLNIEGNILSSNSLLTIAKSTGQLLEYGGNFKNDIDNPHWVNMPAIDTNLGGGFPNEFTYRMQNQTVSGALTSIISNIEDDGTNYPGTTFPSNRWGIDYVFIEDSDRMIIQPTQTDYKTSDDAVNSIGNNTFVIETTLKNEALLLGYIVHRGDATDLSDPADGFFLQANKFGNGTSSSVGGTQSLQSVYDNSINPEIITDATRKGLTIQIGSGADTDDALEVKNTAGDLKLSITGEGDLIYPDSYTEAYSEILSNAATYMALNTTYYVVNFNGVVSNDFGNNFTVSTDARITYTGARTRIFNIRGVISLGHDRTAVVALNFRLHKNGVAIQGSRVQTNIKNEVGFTPDYIVTIQKTVQLATNDYIELYTNCDTDATSLVCNTCNFTATPLPNSV